MVDAVLRARWSIDAIRLPRPECLSDSDADIDLPAALPSADPRDLASVARLKHWLTQADHGIGAPSQVPDDPEGRNVLNAPDPHDAFFRVVRTPDVGMRGYRYGVLQALRLWCDECEGLPMTGAAANLGHGLMGLWHVDTALTPAFDMDDDVALHIGPPGDLDAERAIRRWLLGHQMFAVLTQGLILLVSALGRATALGDDDRIVCLLERFTQLYRASGSALKFTADFPRVHYEQLIRPSMSEPHAPPGFSGTLSSDHAYLVRRLVAAQATMESLAQRFPEHHARVKRALAAMYHDHKLVCERLAGLEQPSVRSSGLSGHRHSAGELLDRFHERRSHLLR